MTRRKETRPPDAVVGRPMQTVLVFDLAGNGFTLLWTLDGVIWVNVSSRPLNAAERDAYLNRWRAEYPGVTVREEEDFYARIPADLLREGTRVI